MSQPPKNDPPPRRPPPISDGDPPPTDPCNLTFSTSLASPEPDFAATAAAGTALTLRLVEDGPYEIVGVVDESDAVVGTIIDEVAQLLDCLKAGRRYSATVTDAPQGGAVFVRIQPTT